MKGTFARFEAERGPQLTRLMVRAAATDEGYMNVVGACVNLTTLGLPISTDYEILA